jgi:arsenite/tail-anchored protein-transporting ATPase
VGIFSRKKSEVSSAKYHNDQPIFEPRESLETRLQLITGKGGVGRTTVAISLAHALAKRGERVLLLEARDADTELQNDYGGLRHDSMLGRALSQTVLTSAEPIALGADPKEVVKNLWCAQLIAPVGHAAFLRSMIPSDRLVKAALDSKPLSKFLRSAPSMHELGLFYHLKQFDEESRFQRIVIDLPATGHTIALSQLPDKISKIIKKGQIVDALRAGMSRISDVKRASMWVVTLPELLPLTEACEVSKSLINDGIYPAGVICNRSLPRPLEIGEKETLEQILETLSESDLNGTNILLKSMIQGQLIDEEEEQLLASFSRIYYLPELNSHTQRVELMMTNWLKGEIVV